MGAGTEGEGGDRGGRRFPQREGRPRGRAGMREDHEPAPAVPALARRRTNATESESP